MKQLMKRTLSVLLVVCLLCTMIPSAFAAEGDGFTDVGEHYWARDAIYEAVEAGYFKGVSDTEFDPEGTMTRAMLVAVMARVVGADVDNDAPTGFTDVPSGKWYSGAIAWAAENGLVSGYGDGTFAPYRAASRQETAAIFLRLLNLLDKTLPAVQPQRDFTDVADISAFAMEAVKTMQMGGVLAGYTDGSFRPWKSITRAEAAALITRLMKAAQDKEPEPTEPTPTEPEPTEPHGPIKVTFVSKYSKAYVDGKPVAELTLPEGVNFVEFIARADDGYEVYNVTATSGRLANEGLNYILAGLTEDVTVTLNDGLTKHTVIFNAGNGTEPEQVAVIHGETVAKPEDPTREDDTFLGWHTGSGEEWDFSKPVMSNMTLFAYWLNDTYVDATVYLDGVNGSDANNGLTVDTPVKTFAAAAALISPKTSNGVIWVLHTMTVLDEQTWDLSGRDCVVKRAPSCTGNMISVDGGSLTLSNVTIDGNADAFKSLSVSAPANNAIYLQNGATLTMDGAAAVTNCFGAQGGAFYVKDSTLVMNSGKIADNTSKFTGGAIYITASSKTASATFTMNGGEISGNVGGSVAAVLNVNGSNPVYINLLGGVIENNVLNSTSASSCAFSITNDGTETTIGGVTIRGNLKSNGEALNAATISGRGVSLIPTDKTDIQDPFYLNNGYTSGKTSAIRVPEGLGKLQGKVPFLLAKEFVGACTIWGGTGEDAYALQQSDLDKVDVLNGIEGAYYLEVNDENCAVLEEVKTNDIVVYLSGNGKDTNDGLTVSTPVQTFDKAKEVLQQQIDAAENIPEDANFVISLVYRVQIKEDCTLSFSEFGENAARCVVRRDATNTSSYMFDIQNHANVTIENFRVDGNNKYLKAGVSSCFTISGGAQVTVNDGVEVFDMIFSASAGVFSLGAGDQQTTLTINGGWYHDLTGYNGVFVFGSGTSLSWYTPGKCVINDCLVENITGTFGTIHAYKFVDVEINGGIFRDITMKNEVGVLAAVNGDANATLTINPTPAGQTAQLDGDIYLINTKSDSDGNENQTEDGYLIIGGALDHDVTLVGNRMVWGTTVAVGSDGYALTKEDLGHVHVVSGDTLILKEKTNSIEIAKTR